MRAGAASAAEAEPVAIEGGKVNPDADGQQDRRDEPVTLCGSRLR